MSCSPWRQLKKPVNLEEFDSGDEGANGGLDFLIVSGCLGIAIAIGLAVANMGKGLKAILLGVICGAGVLVGLGVMLRHYDKWIGLAMTIGFVLVGVMVFVSLFVKKGFLTFSFMKKKV